MATAFHLPDLGEGLAEAEIVAWHVGVGDHVVADQPLLSVETDKAVVELPSPQAGHIAALHGAVGQRVAVGDRVDQDHEFVAGIARHEILASHAAAQTLGDLLQHTVAGLVAERVIDVLEAVEVDEQDP